MINKVTLIGRLGKDPEKKTLPSGASFVRFTMATNESYKDKDGEWKDSTEWHNIIMWRELAERAEKQLKKGGLVFLEGKITYQKYEDKDGKQITFTEINANTFRSLEKSENSYSANSIPPPVETYYPASAEGKNTAAKVDNPANESDDLPF
jgi:single-strand DNA-binding protein